MKRQLFWATWLERWDQMQLGYLPWREYSFKLMFKAIDYWLPEEFTALDLACGPGSISSRLLTRFTEAHSIGIDFDPVLLSIGRNTLGSVDGRMVWIEADLRSEAWASQLPVSKVDAVLSSTAIHWLAPDELIALYVKIGQLVKPGGLFLNADEMRPSSHAMWPFFHDWSRNAWREHFAKSGTEDWDEFWVAVSHEPLFQDLFEIRQQRISTQRCTSDKWGATFPLHKEMLHAAGFQSVDTLWQDGIERIVIALR